jgi:hypothetical protein
VSALKWATDKARNRARRVSRAVLDSRDAGEPFAFEHFGPRTIETAEEVETLLAGLNTPLMHPVIAEIRRVVRMVDMPLTADEIAARVVAYNPHWKCSSVKRRVSDAQLHVVDHYGISERGCACARYVVTP